MIERPFLLDVTRLVGRSWSRRRATGIDRVCAAYLYQLASRAHAVVRYRGALRVIDAGRSDRLFAMLLGNDDGFRRKFLGFVPGVLAAGRSRVAGDGATYLNVSHSDFDLPSHGRWIAQCGLRAVYMIHDLIPITHPQDCHRRAVVRHRQRVLGALDHADGIVVNSRATNRELARFARSQDAALPPTIAAPLAGARLGSRGSSQAPRSPYFLCFGSIDQRKNHLLLLDVWTQLVAELGEQAPRLIIAGQWGIRSGDVRRRWASSADLRRHVTVLDTCDDGELGGLLRGTCAVLLPSRAEGFGLPLVEALEAGVPVIASDLPSFREIGQGIPTLLDPADRDSWHRTIAAFAVGCSVRERQMRRMPEFRKFTWDDHFALVEPWISTLPRPSRPTARTHGQQNLVRC